MMNTDRHLPGIMDVLSLGPAAFFKRELTKQIAGYFGSATAAQHLTHGPANYDNAPAIADAIITACAGVSLDVAEDAIDRCLRDLLSGTPLAEAVPKAIAEAKAAEAHAAAIAIAAAAAADAKAKASADAEAAKNQPETPGVST